MSNINYLSILKRAWTVTWRNKYLWWFGFFIALTGSGSFFNYSTNRGGNSQWFNQQFSAFAARHAGWVILGIIAALAVFILFLILRFLSRGALIKSIEKKSNPPAGGEESNFTLGIRYGKKYFWRIFLISFLLQAVVIAIILLIITPVAFLFMTQSYVLGALLTLAGIIIIIPLLILGFFLRNYSLIYVTLGDLSMVDAIETGYELFRNNIGASILMALIFIPLVIVLGLGLLLVLFFLAVIFFVLGVILFLLFNKIGAAIVLALAILSFLIIFLGARAIYETFYQAAWVFFFHEIASPKVPEAATETVPEIKPAVSPDPAEC